MAADADRTLSQRELNRALLARQFLLGRGRLGLPKALKRIGGIQAQYAPSMYVGLWSRLEGFERAKLTRALERRSVVQGTLLRATIHLVSPADWWRFSIATKRERKARWRRSHRGEPSDRTMDAAARRVRRRLGEGPLTRKEVDELIGMGPAAVSGISLWIDIVRVPPSGTWDRRRADLYGDAEAWLGPKPELSEADATVELVRSYLRGFGPAARGEIADWAGLPVGRVTAALGRIGPRRSLSETGDELVDVSRAALPDPETPAPVRFLPVWDATLLAHARRTNILPEEHRARVFNVKTPQSVNTFLVDGHVAGTWKHERGRVVPEPFARLAAADRKALAEEAERLAELYA